MRLRVPIIRRELSRGLAVSLVAACSALAALGATAFAQRQAKPPEPTSPLQLEPVYPLPELAPPGSAGGEGRSRPEVLWEVYPLNPGTAATPRATATTSPRPRSARTGSAATRPTDSGGETPLVAGLLLAALAGLAALLLLRRRRRHRAPEPPPAPAGTGPPTRGGPPKPARLLAGVAGDQKRGERDE